jgi:16S rRNA processing protein RimM
MTARRPAVTPDSGSPSTGEPEYLVAGILKRPHGVHGEMLMDVVTDFPERLTPGTEVFLGQQHTPCIIRTCRSHAHGMLLGFRGMETPEAAAVFRSQPVYVLSANQPCLPEGQYYHHELLGSTVVDENSRSIGALVEILRTGANDVYIIKDVSGRELLLPVIAGVILEIDPRQRLIRVRIPDGLEADAGS